MDVCGIYAANAVTKTKGQALDNIVSGPISQAPPCSGGGNNPLCRMGAMERIPPPVCSLCDFACSRLRCCAFHERIEEVRVEDCIIVAPVDQAAHVPIER